MTDAKLISYTINDFSTEIEMESFLHLMEKHGDEFYKKLKKHGLIRWRVNQIWNKAGGFALSSIFEYRDQKAFEKSIEEIKNFQKEHENYRIPPGSGKKGSPGPTFSRFGADLSSSWGPKMWPKLFRVGSKRVLKNTKISSALTQCKQSANLVSRGYLSILTSD